MLSLGRGKESWKLLGLLCMHVHAKSLQSCLTVCDPMDCSPPGSSVHGVLQARILEWVALPSSRGYSQPRDRTHVSYVSCIGRQVFYHQCHLGSLLSPEETSIHSRNSFELWNRPQTRFLVRICIMHCSSLHYMDTYIFQGLYQTLGLQKHIKSKPLFYSGSRRKGQEKKRNL